jgi:predicted ArsR family transcriptional regulator
MQSTGQTSTHDVSFVAMHGSLITYAMSGPQSFFTLKLGKLSRAGWFSKQQCEKLGRVDTPTPPDDALAQPTRARLFGLLADLRRPAGTDELAERLKLHPNGVRAHLERLREDGLLVRDRPRHGRGRPRDMWSIAPGARPGGERPSAYGDLGRWLAQALPATNAGLRRVETTGREIGRELAAAEAPVPREARMHATLAALGFQPVRERAGDTLTYRLCNCPYRDAVRANQPVVCTLHRGITRGLLDAIAPETELADFVPRDPDTAGCLIELRDGLAAEDTHGR